MLATLLAIMIHLTPTAETASQAGCEIDGPPLSAVEARQVEARRARLDDHSSPANFSL